MALVLGSSKASAESVDVLAERLAKLRAEVEGLSESLAEAKTESRNDLQSRARQKSDLQLELDREEVRLSKLRSVLSEKKRRIVESSERGDDLKPVFELALSGLRNYIRRSLPFRRIERLAELDKLEEQQRSGILTYGKALVRLWSFTEDELRMSRESASFQQTIEIEGEEKLVDVLRIGMVMLYFQTSDGTTGYSRLSKGNWDFVRAFSPKQSNQIAALFDSFKKQIRIGLFQVPNALPAIQK
jgi:hypothetical protein